MCWHVSGKQNLLLKGENSMFYLLLQISILPETKLNDSRTHAVFPLYSELLHTYLLYLTFTKTLSGRDDYYPSDFAMRKYTYARQVAYSSWHQWHFVEPQLSPSHQILSLGGPLVILHLNRKPVWCHFNLSGLRGQLWPRHAIKNLSKLWPHFIFL